MNRFDAEYDRELEVGFYQKEDELDRVRVRYCPYDGMELKTVMSLSTYESVAFNKHTGNFIPSVKRCVCGFEI